MDRDYRSPHSSPVDGPASSSELLYLEQLRGGDRDAGRRFIQDHYPGVYRYLLYLTGSPEAAEDLTQEAFVQAWRRLSSFEGRAALRTWLHRIAHRAFLQALRSQRVQVSLEEAGEIPEPRAAALTERVELRAIIGKLPVEQREAVVLHYLEGYEYEEIASILAMPISRVRLRLSQARAGLRRELGEGDLSYLNEAPGAGLRRWAWLPLEAVTTLEARLSRVNGDWLDQGETNMSDTTPTGMNRRTLLGAAGTAAAAVAAAGLTGAAGATPQNEAEIIDDRLTRKVTLAVKAMALSDLCDQLRGETGLAIAAGPSVADEKVTLFCEKLPLREVMRQLSRPFGYTWLRSREAFRRSGVQAFGKDTGDLNARTPERPNADYRYELVQDLRSQLLEEELRNRDRSAALLALEREIERYRPYLDLSPAEALERSKSASPDEKKLLEQFAGYGWGAIQMYFRLTLPQQAALRAGEELRFSQEPKPGEQPLPPDVARGVLQSLRDVFFYRGPDSFGLALGVKEPRAGQVSPSALPEARASASLSIRETEPGRIALMYDAGTFSNSDVLRNSGGSWRQGDAPLAAGASSTVAKPDNRAANARLAGDPAMQRRISIRPEGHCRQADGSSPEKEREPVPADAMATTADVLEALHRAAGLPIVSDFYTRLYPSASLTMADQPLFDAINRMGDAMHLRWNRDGDWLQFRSASFYDDRTKEVPNRLLSRWAALRRQHSVLTLDDLTEIAGLTDAELDGQDMAQGARDCWGLSEWDLASSRVLRPHLRFLAELTPAQRQEAMSPSGLAFTKLSLPQQQRYLGLAMQMQDQPLQSLEELEGACLRVEYTHPGGFEWQPPASNLYRWVVPVVPGQEGRRALMPPARGRNREEALAVARRLDARLLDALRLEVQRIKPEVESAQALPEAGEIVPTGLNLWVVYIPGLSNRRNILVVDHQSTSGLSTW